MLLASLLLKLGYLGLLVVSFLISVEILLILFLLGGSGMCFAGLVASFCRERKTLAAYSSITHINLVLLCLMRCSLVGYTSSYILALGHRFISALMFSMVGEFSHVSGTRTLPYNRGFFNGPL